MLKVFADRAEPGDLAPVPLHAVLSRDAGRFLSHRTLAALFLDRFVPRARSFAHFNIAAWIDRPKPGRRKGAQANAIRALFALITERAGQGR